MHGMKRPSRCHRRPRARCPNRGWPTREPPSPAATRPMQPKVRLRPQAHRRGHTESGRGPETPPPTGRPDWGSAGAGWPIRHRLAGRSLRGMRRPRPPRRRRSLQPPAARSCGVRLRASVAAPGRRFCGSASGTPIDLLNGVALRIVCQTKRGATPFIVYELIRKGCAMRIGIAVGDIRGQATLAAVVDQVRHAANLGFDTAWSAQAFGWDALTTLAVAGTQVPGIALGTAVGPVPQRHPLVLAGQALSVRAAVGDRFVLGVGAGVAAMTEGMFGLDAGRPARRMREYLSVLLPLLGGETVNH